METPRFSFETDDDSYTYCLDILDSLVRDHALTHEAALSMMNKHWKGLDMTGKSMIYTETPQTLALWIVKYARP